MLLLYLLLTIYILYVVKCNTVSLFSNAIQGTSVLSNGIPWPIQSALYGAIYYHSTTLNESNTSLTVTSATPYDESIDSTVDGFNRAVVSLFFIIVALVQTSQGPHWNPFKAVHKILYFIYGNDLAPNAISPATATGGATKKHKATSVKQTVGNAVVKCVRVVLGLLLVSTVCMLVYSDKICTQKRMSSMVITRSLCQHVGHTTGVSFDDTNTSDNTKNFATQLFTGDATPSDSTDRQQQQQQQSQANTSNGTDDSTTDASKQAQSIQETLRGGHSDNNSATFDDTDTTDVSANKHANGSDGHDGATDDDDESDKQQQHIDRERHILNMTDSFDTETDTAINHGHKDSNIDSANEKSTAINSKQEVDDTKHNVDDDDDTDGSKEDSVDNPNDSVIGSTAHKHDHSGNGSDGTATVSNNATDTKDDHVGDNVDDKQKSDVMSNVKSGGANSTDTDDNKSSVKPEDVDTIVDEKHNTIDDDAAIAQQQQKQQQKEQQQLLAQEVLTQLTSQLASIADTTAAGSSSDSNVVDISSSLQQAKDSAVSAIQAWVSAGMPLFATSTNTAGADGTQHELLQQAQAQVAAAIALANTSAVPATDDGNRDAVTDKAVTDKTVTPPPTAAPANDNTVPQQQQQQQHQQQPSKEIRAEQKAAAASAREAAKRLKADAIKANKLKAKLQKSADDLNTVIASLQSFAASSSATAVDTGDVDTAVKDAQEASDSATAIVSSEPDNNGSTGDSSSLTVVYTDVAAIESTLVRVQEAVKVAKVHLNTFTSIAQAALKQRQQFDKQAVKVLSECDSMRAKASDSSGSNNIVYAIDDVNTAIAACDTLQTIVSSTDLSQWSVPSSDNSNSSARKALADTDELVKTAFSSVIQHEAAVRAQAQADADAAAKATAAAADEQAKLNSVLSSLKNSLSTVVGVVESLKQLKASPQGSAVAVPVDDSISELEKELLDAKLQVLEADETATVETIATVQKRVLLTANSMKQRLSLLTTVAQQADNVRATALSDISKLSTDVTKLRQQADVAGVVEPHELHKALATIEALQYAIGSSAASQWTDKHSIQQMQSQLNSATKSLETATVSVQSAITRAEQQRETVLKQQEEQVAAREHESQKQFELIPKVLDEIDRLALQVDALQQLAQSPIGDTVADDIQAAIAAATEVIAATNSTMYDSGTLPTSLAMQTALDDATSALAIAVNDVKTLTAAAEIANAKRTSVHSAVDNLIAELNSIHSTLATANEVHSLEVLAPQELLDLQEMMQALQQQLSAYDTVPVQWTDDISVQQLQAAVEHVIEQLQLTIHCVTSAIEQAEQQKATAITATQEQAKLIAIQNSNKASAIVQLQGAVSSMASTITALQNLNNNTAAAAITSEIDAALQQATHALEVANSVYTDNSSDSTSADITAAHDVLVTAEREAKQTVTDHTKLMHKAEQERLNVVKQVNKLDTKLQHIINHAQQANVTTDELTAATTLLQTLQIAVTPESYHSRDYSDDSSKVLLSNVSAAAAVIKDADVSVTHAIAESKQRRADELKQAQSASTSVHTTAAAQSKAATALQAELRLLETAVDAYKTFKQSALGQAVSDSDAFDTIDSVMATYTAANDTACDTNATVSELSDMQTAVMDATQQLQASTTALMATAQRAVDKQAAVLKSIAAIDVQLDDIQSNADDLLDVVANINTTDATIQEQVALLRANMSAASDAITTLKSSTQDVQLSRWTSAEFNEHVQSLQEQAESYVTAAAVSASQANAVIQLAVAAQRKAQKQHDDIVKAIQSSLSWYTMLTHNAIYELEQLLLAYDKLQRSPIGYTVTAAIDDATVKALAALQRANATLVNSNETDDFVDVYEAHEAIAQAVATAASTLQELQSTAQQLHQVKLHATEQLNELKSELSSIEQSADACNITVLPSEVIAAQQLIQNVTAMYTDASISSGSHNKSAISTEVAVNEIMITVSTAIQEAGKAVSLASQAQLQQQQFVNQQAKQQAAVDAAAKQADIAAAQQLLQYPTGAIAALSTAQYLSTAAYLTTCANTTAATETAATQCSVLYIDANSSTLVMAVGGTLDTITTVIWSLPLKAESSSSDSNNQCHGCCLMLLVDGTIAVKQGRDTLWQMKPPTAVAVASKQQALLQLHITAGGELIVASNSSNTTVVIYSVIPVDADSQSTVATASQSRTLTDVVKATASAVSVGLYYIGWVAVTLALG
jgi:hypothetical protein